MAYAQDYDPSQPTNPDPNGGFANTGASSGAHGGYYGSGDDSQLMKWNLFRWMQDKKGIHVGDPDWLQTNQMLGQGSPYINQHGSQQGNYDSLIKMLQQRASGQGPSLAQDAYNRANSDSLNNLSSLSYSGTPGGQRMALQQMGNAGQGLAQGLASARNQEMVSNTGALGQSINMADASELNRQKANQEAWLKMLQEQYGLDKTQTQAAAQGDTNGKQLGSMLQSVAAL